MNKGLIVGFLVLVADAAFTWLGLEQDILDLTKCGMSDIPYFFAYLLISTAFTIGLYYLWVTLDRRLGRLKALAIWIIVAILLTLIVWLLRKQYCNPPPPVESQEFSETIVFADDFSNETQSRNNKWNVSLALPEQVKAAEARFTAGALFLEIEFLDYYLSGIYIREREFENFILEFDAAFNSIEPNMETSIALILPREANKDYFVILFKNNGQIEIAKFDCPFEGTCRYDGAMPYCETAFEVKSGINQFKVSANEGKYELFANDPDSTMPICEFQDEDIGALVGDIGIGVRGSPGTVVSVVFDNLKIFEIIDLEKGVQYQEYDFMAYLELAIALLLVLMFVAYFVRPVNQRWEKPNGKKPTIAATGPDIDKLTLSEGYSVDFPAERVQEYHFTVNNETGKDLKECYVILDESARRINGKDEWEIEQHKMVDRPFRWNKDSNSSNGRLDIEERERASFSLGQSTRYSAMNVQTKQNEAMFEFGLTLYGEGDAGGFGLLMNWHYRLLIAIRSKNTAGEKLPDASYYLYVRPTESSGPAGGLKVDGVVRIERSE